jgi:monovalent cation/proton antiporter MnhG/PhaG subunit
MTEWLAASLLLFGAAIALIAAIGVARLPDAFLRMHAATKAGVVGSGFILLGAGLAFDTGEAWLRVGLIVLFLLVTVPLSSHALGRAAYLGGAPLFPGSGADALAGILPRHAIDRPRRRSASPPPQDAAAPVLPPSGPPRRILLALAQGEHSAAVLRAGLAAVAHPGAEVTLLSLLCAPSLSSTGPVPRGGARHAKRLVEKRMAEAREGAAALAAELASACESQGLAFTAQHEEGDALHLLEQAASRHDLVLLPRGAWFDQALVLPAGLAEARARGIAIPGLLVLAPGFQAPEALHMLHEGDAASGLAFRRFLGLGVFTGRPLVISALARPGAADAVAQAVTLAAAQRWQVRAGETALPPDEPVPPDAFSGATLGIIPAHSAIGCTAWHSLREGPMSVLLA